MATNPRVKRVLRAPAKVIRTFLVPEYEDVLRDLGGAYESVTAAHKGIADLQAETAELRERLADHERRLADDEEAVHEERRLSLRIAELTDVVAELVLPLHDRDIDPKKLENLAPDTL